MEQSEDPDCYHNDASIEPRQSDILNHLKQIYIGNIHLDVDNNLAVRKLKELFLKVDICVPDEKFSTLLRGPGNSKYLFATLRNEEEVERSMKYCDGFKDIEIAADNKGLKVCLKRAKPRRRRRKRKRRSSQTPSESELTENDDCPGITYVHGDDLAVYHFFNVGKQCKCSLEAN